MKNCFSEMSLFIVTFYSSAHCFLAHLLLSSPVCSLTTNHFPFSSLTPLLSFSNCCPHPLSVHTCQSPATLSSFYPSFLTLLFLQFSFIPACQKTASITRGHCITVTTMQIYHYSVYQKRLSLSGSEQIITR